MLGVKQHFAATMQNLPSAPTLALFFVLGMFSPQTPNVLTAELKPETLAAFGRYVQVSEVRIEKELTRPGAFLYIEGLPEPKRSEALGIARRGEVYMEQLRARDASGTPIEAPDGLIHHWIGAVFIPGVSLRQVLNLVEDYDHHQDIYKPEVIRSRLVKQQGNDYRIYYRLRKKKVITVTLNTDHDVQYLPVDSTHCHSRSVATRIAEVVDADQPDEHEKPIGHDGGFLWRMNSYWRFEEKDQGVYVEVESISLTRDIPTGFGWLIKPFVTSIPRESLLMTLGATRSALEARLHAAPQK
ncbi:MAG: hypothetical protein LAO04_08875 [Acidobacteriia bacterium]|nr:hypothetical protein [Terriglobia bacterium]